MALPAIGPRPAVAGVGGQQRLQQRASQLSQPGPHREFCRLQARAARQCGGHAAGQLRYFRSGVGGELLAEPLPVSGPDGKGPVWLGLPGLLTWVCAYSTVLAAPG